MMNASRFFGFSVLLASLGMAGCGSLIGTPYTPPPVDAPTNWQETSSNEKAVEGDWWRALNDPALDNLVKEALARNNDLAAAALKVRQAQMKADIANNGLFPSLRGSGVSQSYKRTLDDPLIVTRSFAGTGTVSYEADLWGKIASESDAAAWEALATEQDRESAALSLAGTAVKLYLQLAYLNEKIALNRASMAYAEKTLNLVKVQHETGAVSGLERAQAEQDLQTLKAIEADLARQRTEVRNAFAILFDAPPGTMGADPPTLPSGEIPLVSAGLPADLLLRRPDLKAAELRLRKSLSTVNATRASFLPTITLTGTLGTSSVSLKDLLQNPLVTLGTGIVLPFLDWQTMENNVAVSKAEYEEAIVSFRQTVYQSFSDVENALSARTHYEEQRVSYVTALDNAQKAEGIYDVRYRTGYAALQDWLNAQEKRRAAESSLLQTRFNQWTNYVTLCLALGGAPQIEGPAL